MSLPLVSVLIDTFNCGQFIEQVIDRVLSQEFPAGRMEILVVDDGSTDDTADRVKKYGLKIQYFRKENGGQASAFNFGFSRSHGDIICFLDADDFWLPNKLRRVTDAFARDTVGMVSNSYELSAPDLDGNIKSNQELVSGDLSKDLDSLLRYRIFPTYCLAFRRETLNRLMPIPEAIRTFLNQWKLFRSIVEFSVIPPTRLQWFFHLLQDNRTYRIRQNWKLTVLNYLSAMATLAWGYKMPRPQLMPPEGGRHA